MVDTPLDSTPAPQEPRRLVLHDQWSTWTGDDTPPTKTTAHCAYRRRGRFQKMTVCFTEALPGSRYCEHHRPKRE